METSRTFGQIECEGKFKSYYVVWKPGTAMFGGVLSRSLNRTMQYGNSGKKIIDIENIKKFKSYYVVWKLFMYFIAENIV